MTAEMYRDEPRRQLAPPLRALQAGDQTSPTGERDFRAFHRRAIKMLLADSATILKFDARSFLFGRSSISPVE
jgi:hypothetical protein